MAGFEGSLDGCCGNGDCRSAVKAGLDLLLEHWTRRDAKPGDGFRLEFFMCCNVCNVERYRFALQQTITMQTSDIISKRFICHFNSFLKKF